MKLPLTLGVKVGPGVTEEVKYGGLVFSSVQPFCGIFSYTAHASLEFSQGAVLADTVGVLEGRGKGRRHIKLRHVDDLRRCRIESYLDEALKVILRGTQAAQA
jgi:hypothetical protein